MSTFESKRGDGAAHCFHHHLTPNNQRQWALIQVSPINEGEIDTHTHTHTSTSTNMLSSAATLKPKHAPRNSQRRWEPIQVSASVMGKRLSDTIHTHPHEAATAFLT